VAHVNALGVLTTGFELGKSEITAADIRGPSLSDSAMVCTLRLCAIICLNFFCKLVLGSSHI